MATLTKTKDLKFRGNHPNGINVGYKRTNVAPSISIPTVGKNYYFSGLMTTEVVEVNNITKLGFNFKTKNSEYRVDYG